LVDARAGISDPARPPRARGGGCTSMPQLCKTGFVWVPRQLGFVRARGSGAHGPAAPLGSFERSELGSLGRGAVWFADCLGVVRAHGLPCCACRARSVAARLGFVWISRTARVGTRWARVSDEMRRLRRPGPIGPTTARHRTCADHGALLPLDVHRKGGRAAGGFQCSRLWESIQSGQPRTDARPTEAGRNG
jgi:hypothetical protein